MNARHRVLIVAGEASGDLHGADLAAEMRAREPECEVFGIAGEKMRTAGVRALYRSEDLAAFGVTEVATTISHTLGALLGLRRLLKREPPDLVVLIDFAEFNMILSRAAKRSGVPVLYYITPQVWAWRGWRIHKLIARADELAVVLPFEADLFKAAGGRARFVGHPLLDRVHPAQDRAGTMARHGFDSRARLLAILPGSRQSEIRHLLRPMIEAARMLARDQGLVPCLALAPTLTRAQLEASGVNLAGIQVIGGDTYSIVAHSEVALVTSGTATLETALLGCPMVIAYKLSPLSYLVGRLLVRGVEYFGMPNILAGQPIVPELLQSKVTANNLVRAAENLLIEPVRGETIAALKTLRARLGAPGAAGRVADLALGMMA